MFPIVIFATDATERGPLVTARRAAMQRAGVTEVSDSVRQARRRAQRQRIRPTLGAAALGVTVQLVSVAMFGIVGRRFFGLRL